jgi:hypothetical protein
MSEGWEIFLISQAVAIMGGLVAIYVRVNIKLTELYVRMRVSEKRIESVELTDNKMNDKLDTIIQKVSDVQIELQNKENRKN